MEGERVDTSSLRVPNHRPLSTNWHCASFTADQETTSHLSLFGKQNRPVYVKLSHMHVTRSRGRRDNLVISALEVD